MAGSADLDSGRSAVFTRTGGAGLGSRDREESVYSDRKGEDVRLLLAASVPQGRIAKLTTVSLCTIRRIAPEPAEPAEPHSGAKPRRSGPARPSVVGPYRQVIADRLAAELDQSFAVVAIAVVLLDRVHGKVLSGRGLAIRATRTGHGIPRTPCACGDVSL